jgi:hypothetical protein
VTTQQRTRGGQFSQFRDTETSAPEEGRPRRSTVVTGILIQPPSQPQIIILEDGRIKTCSGCPYNRPCRFFDHDAEPPHNLIFRLLMRRTWFDEDGNLNATHLPVPAYFHANSMACIRKIPGFETLAKRHVHMWEETIEHLTPEHILWLEEKGYWNHIVNNNCGNT